MKLPPLEVVPYKLPVASRITPPYGTPPSLPLVLNRYRTVSVKPPPALGESSNTSPCERPVEEYPPCVVPYRLPEESRVRPANGFSPSFVPPKLWITFAV